MPLDPRAERLLRMLSASTDGPRAETTEDRRRGLASLAEMVGGAAPDMAAVDTLACPGPDGPAPIRRYRPKNIAPGAILYLHGGGWVAGSLDTHDGVCRRLANASGRTVFAVDYRLAPEHPFPAGLKDAVAAIRWLQDEASALGVGRDLVVAGDSAGGTLAAAACLALPPARKPTLLLLICPILDIARESASRREYAKGYFLSRETLARDLADYAPPGADLADPRLSPLYADDLSALPPTQVHVAEFDPFRDEGLALAARLQAAGRPVTSTLHPGMIHYFYAMPGAIPYADKALTEIGTAVRTALER
jgi:acetyl esterase/lipase